MHIHITPETEAERQRMIGKHGVDEIIHSGIKEFFMFGNKKDDDGDLIDFHDWNGSYRYLEGSLHFFLTGITAEKNEARNNDKRILNRPPLQGQVKTPFIKRGQIDGDVQIVNIEANKETPKNDTGKAVKFDDGAAFLEKPVEDEELEAEDKPRK